MRLGLVGAGSVASLHVRAAERLPGVSIAAICDVRYDAAQLLATHAGARAYDHHRDMFAAGDLDGVIITAPHALHLPIAVDAAEAGLHILMEKPMATSVADCRQMIEVAERHGVRLVVGNLQRYAPSVREAVKILRTGRIGDPLLITERRAVTYDRESRPAWFFDPDLAGGGIMMNIGGHCIDKAQVLAGATAVGVHAQIWRRPGIDVETEAVGLLELANGTKTVFSVTSTGLPPQDETEVVCTDGALRLSESAGLWLYQNGTAVLIREPDLDDVIVALTDQLADFTSADPSSVDGDYGLSVVAAVMATYESSDRSIPVRIPALIQEAAV